VSPLDATALALEAQLDAKDAANPEALALRIKIDGNNLTLEQRTPLDRAVRSGLVQTDAQGSERESVFRPFPWISRRTAYEATMKQD